MGEGVGEWEGLRGRGRAGGGEREGEGGEWEGWGGGREWGRGESGRGGERGGRGKGWRMEYVTGFGKTSNNTIFINFVFFCSI